MRHIAFLSEHASPVATLGSVDAGGQNVYVDEVSRGLASRGYRVDVFTRWERPDAPEVLDWAPGVRVVNLWVGPPKWVCKDELWPLMPAFRDAVLRFMLTDGTHYDLIHGNFWMSGWVGVELGRRCRVPTVQIFHAMGKTKQRHQGTADTSPAVRIDIERQVVRRADRLIAQCPAEAGELIDDYGASPERVEVIPSGVNTRLFCPVDRREARRRLGLDLDDRIVVYVGRMLPRKDIRNVVRAVALLRRDMDLPVRLLLVGGETPDPDPTATPEIGELQRLAAELDVADRLTFTGKRQPHMLRYYYGAGDVVVTTPWYEPFGLTPLEGMACGRPVIGSAVGGIAFTVVDGVTGYLVPPRAPQALATRLAQLLRDPELQRRMGGAALRRVRRGFEWPTVARRTAALYEAVLEPAATPAVPLEVHA
ncbi:MAG TPA: glycosyltransferase [Chloroflexota bacterium]|nr:glycosyltransferase [Chloroflexota bacterium]